VVFVRTPVAVSEARPCRFPADCAAGRARPGGISERSRIAVKGLTVMHDDAVDKMPIAGKPEIVADAA
jgi:hypothetical protein